MLPANTFEGGLSMETLNPAHLSLTIPSSALWVIFLIMVIFSGVMTIVLFYHWFKYGASIARTSFMGTLYLAGAGFLLLVMLSSVIGYTSV